MQYTLVGTDDGSNITVFIPGQAPLVAHSTHPNFDTILGNVVAGDSEGLADLFDVSKSLEGKFERLSDRISVQFGRLFFDGDEVDNSLATQAVRLYESGSEDYKPLVNFFEKVQTNASEHSREQLYDWLNAADFTITPDGLIVGYKGVSPETLEDGTKVFKSINSGRAIVNGVVKNGHIPQQVGDVVEMPRSEVQFDPNVGCSTGLHIGTWDYASGFARGTVLEVHVDPRDVVSVPTECSAQKMRVCRYTVVGETEVAYTEPVYYGEDWEGYDDEEDDDFWGDRDFYGEDDDDEFDVEDDEDFGFDYFNSPRGGTEIDTDVSYVASEKPSPYHGDPGDENDSKSEIQVTILPGTRFEDTDARRAGNVFKVESVDDTAGTATGKWEHSGLTRTIAIDRLLSRKYKQVR